MNHSRKIIRIAAYDYSTPGAYYVTIRVKNSDIALVSPEDGCLTSAGAVVQSVWSDLPTHYSNVECDEFVVMSDHVHCIIVLKDDGAGFKPAPTAMRRHGLPEIVRGFKTFSSRKINDARGVRSPVWQRNYYERVIRNERELNAVRGYIHNNPLAAQLKQRSGHHEW
jgi:putative transposase